MIYEQAGVIPYRVRDGRTEILLVTSRSRGVWIVPKGLVEPGEAPQEAAAHEAWEEAGIRGVVSNVSIGRYEYEKWEGTCRVQVFPMKVDAIGDVYPEAGERQRIWVEAREAADRVEDMGLKKIVRDFADGI